MSRFLSISNKEFIQKYWQQQPLICRHTCNDLIGIISGDEIADLACNHEVESRIILGHRLDDEWRCQHGSFCDEDFKTLPKRDWSLLVQGVEQWDKQIKTILDQFSFLSCWRLEDIMASYAPIGGGVGPHYDNYDVFLIQISGSRDWRLGQTCDENSELIDNQQVKLLRNFDTRQQQTLTPGDLLYVPAGVAHWGIASSDDCITLSVGFRAPSNQQILSQALMNLIEQVSDDNSISDKQKHYYKDTPRSIDEHPHKINQTAFDTIDKLFAEIKPQDTSKSLELAFGQLVTQTRYPAIVSPVDQVPDSDQINHRLAQSKTIVLHHSDNCRFAFSETHLFVNGEAYECNAKFSQSICDKVLFNLPASHEISVLVELMELGFIRINTGD